MVSAECFTDEAGSGTSAAYKFPVLHKETVKRPKQHGTPRTKISGYSGRYYGLPIPNVPVVVPRHADHRLRELGDPLQDRVDVLLRYLVVVEDVSG